MNKKNLLIAAAFAGMLAASPAHAKVKCHGANACRGQGACGGKGHGCAGKNECKGKGWLKADSAEQCKEMKDKKKK